MLLGGWEEGLKEFFGQDDAAVALLGGKGGFVYGTILLALSSSRLAQYWGDDVGFLEAFIVLYAVVYTHWLDTLAVDRYCERLSSLVIDGVLDILLEINNHQHSESWDALLGATT